jgi:hypothetical protein
MKGLSIICSLLLLATAAEAQQRRSAGGGAAPEPRETIAPMPRFPYAGTWHGQMKLHEDAVPISVDIAVMNDKYTSVSYGPGGGRMNHLSTELGEGLVRWQIKNSGQGVWVYEAKRIVGDTIFGTVALKDGLGRDGQPVSGTILLVRQRP